MPSLWLVFTVVVVVVVSNAENSDCCCSDTDVGGADHPLDKNTGVKMGGNKRGCRGTTAGLVRSMPWRPSIRNRAGCLRNNRLICVDECLNRLVKSRDENVEDLEDCNNASVLLLVVVLELFDP